MTEADLTRIEDELAIRLPVPYRAVLLAYPVPACQGNADTELWDDAPRLVALNQELRSGRYGVKPWPAQFFALGTDAGGSTQALDLENGTVLWADRCHLPALGRPQGSMPFEAWCQEYVAGLRSDLAGEGIDPDGSAEDARRQQDLNYRSSTRACGGCLVALLALLGSVIAWRFAG